MTTTKFQQLDGKEVSRKYLQQLIEEAKQENNTEVVYRLSKILLDNPKYKTFTIQVKSYPTSLNAPRHKGAYKEALTSCGRLRKGWRFIKGSVVKARPQVPKPNRKGLAGTKQKEGLTSKGRLKKGYKYKAGGNIVKVTSKKKSGVISASKTPQSAKGLPIEFLAGLDYIEAEDNEINSLNAPVKPDQIYQMITDMVVDAVNKSKGDGKLGWNQDFFYGGYQMPANFISNKTYRGVNVLLLKNGNPYTVFKNPYFLTRKQINEKGGKIRLGAKGQMVVYFTRLYKFEGKEKKDELATYNKGKMIQHLKSKGLNDSHFDVLVETIPILKYYKIFNGEDIKGIDFKLDSLSELDKLRLGFLPKDDAINTDAKNQMAELIIKNFPKNTAKIKHGYKGASYNGLHDVVKMPNYEAFYKSENYYSTLFHEMIHSTGHPSRLNRPLGNPFGSVPYAKEELIAEFGAVFLSAQAGILWKTQQNHADYLKNWQMALQFMGEDKTLLMRSATEAQKAVDYLLQVDENKEPKFYREIKKVTTKPTPKLPPKQLVYVTKSTPKKPILAQPIVSEVSAPKKRNSLAYKRSQRKNKTFEMYDIQDKDLATFLGDLEIKSKESLVLTIAGKQGSGKTRFAFRFMNILAQKYKVGHASMEEHPDSKVYWDKVDMYFNKKAEENIDNPEIKNLSQLDKLIKENEVIVIDSFAKLKELDNKLEVDTHLRKKYNGKLFLIVFQQTTDGKMRGGSKSGFDGDCIFFVEKDADFKKYYVYTDKNRYQTKSLEKLQYNIYSGKLNNINSSTEEIQEVEF
jgi:antirestriction protein ArdC/tRNA A37 threonylcarbamoyladenosine biosynthesis protein TsaE